MNYATYMRKQAQMRENYIGFQNGQDASQVTLKNQALANTVKTPVAVATSFSKIGGTVANITQATQQTCSPTSQTCSSGYQGVSQGFQTNDPQASLIGAAQQCALAQFSSISSAPYGITIPCQLSFSTFQNDILIGNNAPGQIQCCGKDMSDLYRNNSELIATEGKAEDIRESFNKPAPGPLLPPQPNGIPRNLKGLRAWRF
jgi:hypothetical protein